MFQKHLAAKATVAVIAALFAATSWAELAKSPMHANLPANADKTVCLACHQSYAAVAEKTKTLKPNPHSSHRGEPNCTNCHSIKGKDHFECNDCHNFEIKMKGE